MSIIWINPVVRGRCLGGLACNGGCCRVRKYTDANTYTETFCEHYIIESGTCGIYETRPEGCRRYPEVTTLVAFGIPSGCGYSLEEE